MKRVRIISVAMLASCILLAQNLEAQMHASSATELIVRFRYNYAKIKE